MHFSDEKDSGSHDQNENTIVSDDNIEKHSSNECDGEESSEEDESSSDDRSLENKPLENHKASQCVILAKAIAFTIKASMNAFTPASILITLYEDTCVKYVKSIVVVSHVHLVGIEVFGPIQV